MRRLFPALVRELIGFARECVTWTLVGVVFLLGLWLLTDGLPRAVAVINGLTAAHVIHPVATQLDAPSRLTGTR